MRSVKAIFSKQLRDIFKNKMVLIQFIVFPIVAFVFTEMVARPMADIPDSVFYTMQVNVLLSDVEAGFTKPALIVLANIAVFAALFTLAYNKKGLRG